MKLKMSRQSSIGTIPFPKKQHFFFSKLTSQTAIKIMSVNPFFFLLGSFFFWGGQVLSISFQEICQQQRKLKRHQV